MEREERESSSGEQPEVNLQHPDALVIFAKLASAHAFGRMVPDAWRLDWRLRMIDRAVEKSVHGSA
jgi:hypothetical protein